MVHTEPRGTSPDISMIPAPVMPVTSAHTSQSRFVSSFRRPAGDEVSEDAGPALAWHRLGASGIREIGAADEVGEVAEVEDAPGSGGRGPDRQLPCVLLEELADATMTPTVDPSMKVTPLRSTTRGASSTPMARSASPPRSSPSRRSCSPWSQTTAASGDYVSEGRGREGHQRAGPVR